MLLFFLNGFRSLSISELNHITACRGRCVCVCENEVRIAEPKQQNKLPIKAWNRVYFTAMY